MDNQNGLSIRKYHKSACITFKSTKGKNGALSNMAPGFPLKVNDIHIRTSEALYQALRFPDAPAVQERIIRYPSPISAKRYGRTVLFKSRKDWDVHRFAIMRMCLEIKLFQNFDKFSKHLLATQDLPIVEYTDKDKIWGATLEGDYYSGTNALGRLLMEVREKIIQNSFELTIPKIDNLRLFDREITEKSVPNKHYHP